MYCSTLFSTLIHHVTFGGALFDTFITLKEREEESTESGLYLIVVITINRHLHKANFIRGLKTWNIYFIMYKKSLFSNDA